MAPGNNTNMVTCSCCNKSFDKHLMVQCSVCYKSFKNSCVDITATEVRTINANKGYDWSCVNCRAFGNDLKALKAMIISLQEDIQALKNEHYNVQKSENAELEDIIQEINERNKRKCNLILFGIPEKDHLQPPLSRAAEETTYIKEVLTAIDPEANIENIKPNRLGSFNNEKTRPIKITLPSEHQVTQFIRRAKNLKNINQYKKISISFDRTPRQIEYYKKIKQQLIYRQSQGETNCRIKYINGMPKIVSNSLN